MNNHLVFEHPNILVTPTDATAMVWHVCSHIQGTQPFVGKTQSLKEKAACHLNMFSFSAGESLQFI